MEDATESGSYVQYRTLSVTSFSIIARKRARVFQSTDDRLSARELQHSQTPIPDDRLSQSR